jgi:metal-responsive CopG/Arc/MetJ family transcriptional regulator
MIVKVTLSLPDKVLQNIDHDRGDIARSRFVMRLIEKAYQLRDEEPQQGAQVTSHRRPAAVVEATDNPCEGGSSRSNG